MPHLSIFLPCTPTHCGKYVDYYLPPIEENSKRWQIVNVQLNSEDEVIENNAQLLASLRAHTSAYVEELDMYSAILNDRFAFISFIYAMEASPLMDPGLEMTTISLVQQAVLKRCIPLIFFDSLLKNADEDIEIGAIFPLPYSNHFDNSDSDSDSGSEISYDSADDAQSDSELH